MDSTAIHQLTEKYYEKIVFWRRLFRTHPELSGQEHSTQRRIIEELSSMGIGVRTVGTGVIGDLTGGLPGKLIAIRADMDALPIADEIDKPYRSQEKGVCHACGHDAHMAMLLGVAAVFAECRQGLKGSLRFIFQPHEECFPGGAPRMIAAGALDGVDVILGAHVWQSIPVGRAGITYGPIMAAPDEFIITVKGRGGHAAMPHETINPILAGAHIVTALNTIVATQLPPHAQAVVAVGAFKAGEPYNIIPDTAVIKGTVRTFDEEIRKQIHQRIEEICRGICLSLGAQYHVETILGFPAVINHRRVSALLAESAGETLGAKGIDEIEPVMGGEDFSYYLEKTEGAFFFVGVGNGQPYTSYPHHHPQFDLDETGLKYGVQIMGRTICKLLEE